VTQQGAHTPLITVALVNYNGLEFLDACLGSLREQESVRIETFFIDNASNDGSAAFVREAYPEARIIENADNLGYSAALNQAADAMTGDYLLALNTDIRLEPTCLARLAACIERHGDETCGYAQGKIRYMTRDGTPTSRLYSTGHLFALNRLVYNRGAGQVDRGQYGAEQRVPGGNAACLLIRREMMEDMRTDVGVFDPLFFLYGGDVDFDWLAVLRGWACWYCPEAAVFHIGEGSSRVSSRGYSAEFINARFLAMLKNDRPADFLLDLPRILKRNVQDIGAKVLGNPRLLWRLPVHLLTHLVPAIRSRRATRALRAHPAMRPREWMRWSTALLKESIQAAGQKG